MAWRDDGKVRIWDVDGEIEFSRTFQDEIRVLVDQQVQAAVAWLFREALDDKDSAATCALWMRGEDPDDDKKQVPPYVEFWLSVGDMKGDPSFYRRARVLELVQEWADGATEWDDDPETEPHFSAEDAPQAAALAEELEAAAAYVRALLPKT
jgi:hypothetical protein